MARALQNPASRCVEIACVARFAPDEFVVPLAKEALSNAFKATHPFHKVAATAPPLRALIERNHETLALELLPPILESARQIEPSECRAPALFHLFETFFPLPVYEPILAALIRSCEGHCRNNYHLRNALVMLGSENPAQAQEFAEAMRDGKTKRQTLRRLAAGEEYSALPFFGKPLFEF